MKTTDSSNLSFDDAVIQAKKELGGARVYLSLALPFFSSLFSHLKVYFSDKLPTAGVSADDRLFINPHFFIGLPNVNQRAFLLAHEVLHPALGYFFRSRMMIPGLANIAHDHIINLILAGENSEWFIEGGYKDEKYKGWAFEQIYADLLTQHAKQPQRSGAGDGAGEDGEGQGEANKPAKRGKAGQGGKPGKGKSDGVGGAIGKDTLTVEEANKILGIEAQPGAAGQMESEKKQREWNHRLLHAAITARSQGKGSAGIDRLVETMHDSTVPWTEVLKLAVSEAHTRSRIDWSYPSRRTESLGLDHWPREEYLGFEAAVYVDSSGSISPNNLAVACVETREILELAGGSVRWMEGDAGVLKDEWIGEAPQTIKGGGGTSFVPVFEHLRDNPPKALIIFTDTFGSFPDFVPEFPVIWCVFQSPGEDVAVSRKVPFGEIIAVPDTIGLRGQK